MINGYGFLFVAGFTATNKLYGLLEMAAISYGYAIVTYVGQNLGAGKIDRIRKGVRSSMPVSYTHLDVYKRQLLYHGAVDCTRSVKDCPTAYRLRLVP